MSSWLRLLLAAAVLLPACTAPQALPEGHGRGLVSWDRVPPAGAEAFDRPEWTVGDRFIFRRGEGVRLVEEESGLIHLLDPDLGVGNKIQTP